MLCRGKERHESAPILRQTIDLLSHLASSLPDREPVLRGKPTRDGHTQPLGEDGMNELLARLFTKAGTDIEGHDLRRISSSLITEASDNESTAMGPIRDIIPGWENHYISYPPKRLVLNLARYSPSRSPKLWMARE
jgi:hypothetical protein